MYGHEVIKDFKANLALERKIRQRGMEEHSLFDDPQQTTMKFVIKHIQNAHHFHIGDIDDITFLTKSVLSKQDNGKIFLNELAEDVRLPYNLCWFDFYHNDDNVDQSEFNLKHTFYPKQGMLVISRGLLNKLYELLMIVPCYTIPDGDTGNSTWIPGQSYYHMLVGRVFTKEEASEILKSSFGRFPDTVVGNYLNQIFDGVNDSNVIRVPMFKGASSKSKYQEFLIKHDEDNKEADRQSLSILNAFILVMNCQNVYTDEIVRKKVVIKKKRKKLIPNKKLFVYKVLNVKLPKASKKYESVGDPIGKMRVHFRRGHYKTYTEDAPLFGRCVGRWWWQRATRGNKERGVVAKKYRAQTPN